MQNACPVASAQTTQQHMNRRTEPADTPPRGEAVTKTTHALNESYAQIAGEVPMHTTKKTEPAKSETASAPQTRSKTATRNENHRNHGKGSDERGQQVKLKAVNVKARISADGRSRSNSEPNLRDAAQTKITRYLAKSSSDESEGDEDEETEDDHSELTPESPDLPISHDKQCKKGRKRRRKNAKN